MLNEITHAIATYNPYSFIKRDLHRMIEDRRHLKNRLVDGAAVFLLLGTAILALTSDITGIKGILVVGALGLLTEMLYIYISMA